MGKNGNIGNDSVSFVSGVLCDSIGTLTNPESNALVFICPTKWAKAIYVQSLAPVTGQFAINEIEVKVKTFSSKTMIMIENIV